VFFSHPWDEKMAILSDSKVPFLSQKSFKGPNLAKKAEF
jgi:hypothetical protein